ncbi:hypothetical protein RRG08_014459 [Elysia crispata]|uniref:Uncharacterized protein n=1 Tax=Elysia crispata TaxID=231223 RepID=A0AAE0YGV7_9GAST|nr:hypothetical protein RRG08_014459 [Elysia crispata]
MERFLRPERFDGNPDSPDAAKNWTHWRKTFENFISSVQGHSPDKFQLLTNFIAPSDYEYIAESTTYEIATETLEKMYVKPGNEIFARHILATTKQEAGQTMDQFLQKLKGLSKDCNFQAVSAEKNRQDAIRDAFISGLNSHQIRQRLLENCTLDLQRAYDLARSLEMAEKQSMTYVTHTPCQLWKERSFRKGLPIQTKFNEAGILSCYESSTKYLGDSSIGSIQSIKGNYQRLYQRSYSQSSCGHGEYRKLCSDIAKSLKVSTMPSEKSISMASSNLSSVTQGHCFVNLNYQGQKYNNVKLSLLPGLCSDIILGHDFLDQHKRLEISFKGEKPTFSVCIVAAARIEARELFKNLTPDC